MEKGSHLGNEQHASLRAQSRQAARMLQQETRAEKSAAAKARKLEYEFGTTIALKRPAIRPQSTIGARPSRNRKKGFLLRSVRHASPFSGPVAVSRTRYSADRKRSFTYKLEPIPKTAVPRRLKTGTKIAPGAAEGGVRYFTGLDGRGEYLIGDRTQLDIDNNSLILSNIDKDPEKCCQFFRAVEAEERNAKPDRVMADFGKCQWLWRKVVAHPECDPAVSAAYHRDPYGTADIELCRGAESLRGLLRTCDYRPRLSARKQKLRDSADGIKWRLGRGGRTQWRVVVNLPWEFNDEQRREAVQEICDLFAAKGCMYVGVIHLPSASNTRKNVHCHIDLYDRPCRRLNGTRADLRNVPKKWRKEVIKDMRRGVFVDDRGKWDFEVARQYKSASGNKLSHKIFRAPKSSAMRDYSLPKQSRRDVSEIINRIAVRDLGRELYDSRTYAEMGIDKAPDEPVGPNAHAMEGKGGSSEAGSRNEDKHADAARRAIARDYHQRLNELAHTEWSLLAQTLDHLLLGVRLDAREKARQAIQKQRELAELQYDAALLQLEIRRQLSSSYHVIRTSSRIIRMGEDKHGDRAVLREEARGYWRQWVTNHAAEVDLLKTMKATIKAAIEDDRTQERVACAIAPPTPTEISESRKRQRETGKLISGSAPFENEVTATLPIPLSQVTNVVGTVGTGRPAANGTPPFQVSGMQESGARTLDKDVSEASLRATASGVGAGPGPSSPPRDPQALANPNSATGGTNQGPLGLAPVRGGAGEGVDTVLRGAPAEPGDVPTMKRNIMTKAGSFVKSANDNRRGSGEEGGATLLRRGLGEPSDISTVKRNIMTHAGSFVKLPKDNRGGSPEEGGREHAILGTAPDPGAPKTNAIVRDIEASRSGVEPVGGGPEQGADAVMRGAPAGPTDVPTAKRNIMTKAGSFVKSPKDNRRGSTEEGAREQPALAGATDPGASNAHGSVPKIEALRSSEGSLEQGRHVLTKNAASNVGLGADDPQVTIVEVSKVTPVLAKPIIANEPVENGETAAPAAGSAVVRGTGETWEPSAEQIKAQIGVAGQQAHGVAAATPGDPSEKQPQPTPDETPDIPVPHPTLELAQLLARGPDADLNRLTAPAKDGDPSGGPSLASVPQGNVDANASAGASHQRPATDSATQVETPDLDPARQDTDTLVNLAERMKMACIQRIEARHVRLIEVDGSIVAAADQPLERGDAIFMVAAQDTLRAAKARQDELASTVAKELLENAKDIAAGRIDKIDPLTMELKEKWAADPAIAAAIAKIGARQPALAIHGSHEAGFRTVGGGTGVA